MRWANTFRPFRRAVAGILLVGAAPVHAANAPVIPEETAADANPLLRAVWACEAGAQHAETAARPDAGVRPRFFLGTIDGRAEEHETPPLTLTGSRLTGSGQVSDDAGWSRIGFECTLSADLRQATAFAYKRMPALPETGTAPRPEATEAAGAAGMSWYVADLGGPFLFHGIPETDDRDFVARCGTGPDTVAVTLTRTTEWLKEDTYVLVGLTIDAGSGLYVARGVLDENLGAYMPGFTITETDPLLAWLAKGRSLRVNIGNPAEVLYEVSLKGSAKPIKDFAVACGG